jgi:hypothetical protein
MRHAEDELPPSSLRGRLCEVFFSALMTEMIDPLMRRLGDKAELSDPIFGGATGVSPLKERLGEWTKFLADHDARYDRTITVVGADRDVTEGTLELRLDGHTRTLPIALLMERRGQREVALRVFMATSVFSQAAAKGPTSGEAQAPTSMIVPSFASDLLAALAKRDAKAVEACFEQESGVRDALGNEHARSATVSILTKPLTVRGVADNGQVCALEATLEGTQRLALLVLQRGDSGLVRSLRIYSET